MENREFYINDDGIKLHAKLDFPTEEKEKYPLVIVIHGFTGHMEEEHIVGVSRAMNEIGFATLRAEMYGHGGSDGAFHDHTLFKWIGNAMAVTDYARNLDFVSDLYLCGHSQGGLLTMLIGGMEHDVFRAIIPLSPASMIPANARRGELLGQTFDPDHIPDELESWDGLTLGGNYIRAAQMLHIEDAIRRFTNPVLLVHGSADEAVPLSCSEEAAEAYKDAKLVVIPDDLHCYDYHLDMVEKAVQDFLLSLD